MALLPISVETVALEVKRTIAQPVVNGVEAPKFQLYCVVIAGLVAKRIIVRLVTSGVEVPKYQLCFAIIADLAAKRIIVQETSKVFFGVTKIVVLPIVVLFSFSECHHFAHKMEQALVFAIQLQKELLLLNPTDVKSAKYYATQMEQFCVQMSPEAHQLFAKHKHSALELHQLLQKKLSPQEEHNAVTYAILLMHDAQIPLHAGKIRQVLYAANIKVEHCAAYISALCSLFTQRSSVSVAMLAMRPLRFGGKSHLLLPIELNTLICMYLPIRDIVLGIMRTNKTMQALVQNSTYLWQFLGTRDCKKVHFSQMRHYAEWAKDVQKKRQEEEEEDMEFYAYGFFD